MNRRLAALAAAALLVAAAGCGALPGGSSAPGNESAPDGTAERVNETYFTYDGERITVEPAPDQRITGHVNESLDVESVTVRVKSTDASSPFLRSADAAVNDGTFTATVNLTNVAANTTFTAVVSQNGTTLAETEGKVVSESG